MRSELSFVPSSYLIHRSLERVFLRRPFHTILPNHQIFISHKPMAVLTAGGKCQFGNAGLGRQVERRR